jgi:hypothetical protein
MAEKDPQSQRRTQEISKIQKRQEPNQGDPPGRSYNSSFISSYYRSNSLIFGKILAFRKGPPRNPSRPPFFKGRRAFEEFAMENPTFSLFGKGEGREIVWPFKRLKF